MAYCEECGNFDDNWVDGEDITEEELEKDPLYRTRPLLLLARRHRRRLSNAQRL